MSRWAMVAVALTLAAEAARAECDLAGNCYAILPQAGGGAHVQGFNTQTGSMWSTDIDRRGNQRGMDANGNMWSYDRGSGHYFNYGTGQMCTGTGAARICN